MTNCDDVLNQVASIEDTAVGHLIELRDQLISLKILTIQAKCQLLSCSFRGIWGRLLDCWWNQLPLRSAKKGNVALATLFSLVAICVEKNSGLCFPDKPISCQFGLIAWRFILPRGTVAWAGVELGFMDCRSFHYSGPLFELLNAFCFSIFLENAKISCYWFQIVFNRDVSDVRNLCFKFFDVFCY